MIHKFENGDIYNGDFVEGKRQGEGTYCAKSGSKYVGAWYNDKREGAGEMTFSTKDKDGRETYHGSYEGNWKRDKKDGKGIYKHADGSVYDGDWKKDKMHGYGLYTFATKERYEGQFKSGNMHGKGVFIFKNGDQIQGNWVDDREEGIFIRTTPTGMTRKEEWSQGELASCCEFTQGAKQPAKVADVSDLMEEDDSETKVQADDAKPAEDSAVKSEAGQGNSEQSSLLSGEKSPDEVMEEVESYQPAAILEIDL